MDVGLRRELEDGCLRLVQAAAQLSEESIRKVWDNEEDAVYDEL